MLVEIENGKLVATVKDTGPGVPPSFLPELFEPFKQAQTRGSQRGTGLGLSIVKQLLHNMKGTISVESRHPEAEHVELGQTGSTFKMSIPVQSGTPVIEASVTPRPKIAILHGGNERALEGLEVCWETFGFEIVIANDSEDLASVDWKYIWADLRFLKANPSSLHALLNQNKWPVLVPYDTLHPLHQIPEPGSTKIRCKRPCDTSG